MSRVLCKIVAILFVAFVASHAAAASISKNQREGVVFVTDLRQGSDLERSFYQVVQFAAATGAQTVLGPNYERVTVVQGANATLDNLAGALRTAANRSNIRAVDLIFVTHGLSNEVVFANGRHSMATVRSRIVNSLSAAQRSKLRMVFSTACFGSSHRTAWTEAGFKTASGSRGIYADSASSYAAFLGSWIVGVAFSHSVNVANSSDPLKVSDNGAKAWFLSKGRVDLANQVDSHRLVRGSSSLSINTMP